MRGEVGFPLNLYAVAPNVVELDGAQEEATMTTSPIRPGDRIRLVLITDELTKLRPGSLGTVSCVDDLGTVHVRWDDGNTLGLVPGEDRWELVERARA